MDLGFIDSKTYNEISIGDIATTEHVFTNDDALAFASISGFRAVLNSDEQIERAGGVQPFGPNMWCASLISGLFSMNTPGPGCTLTDVCLSFHHRIRAGEKNVGFQVADEERVAVLFEAAATAAGDADGAGGLHLLVGLGVELEYGAAQEGHSAASGVRGGG